MGDIIWASELETGDLYRDYQRHSRFGPGGPIVRQVTGQRTVRTVETYTVLTTLDIEGRGLRGEINLLSEFPVERLERVGLREVEEILKTQKPDEHLTVTYYDGGFWV